MDQWNFFAMMKAILSTMKKSIRFDYLIKRGGKGRRWYFVWKKTQINLQPCFWMRFIIVCWISNGKKTCRMKTLQFHIVHLSKVLWAISGIFMKGVKLNVKPIPSSSIPLSIKKSASLYHNKEIYSNSYKKYIDFIFLKFACIFVCCSLTSWFIKGKMFWRSVAGKMWSFKNYGPMLRNIDHFLTLLGWMPMLCVFVCCPCSWTGEHHGGYLWQGHID